MQYKKGCTNMKQHIRGNFIGRLQLSDGIDRHGIKHVQLLRTGTFKHPRAPEGAFQITPETLLKMKANFDGNARRLDKGEIPVDYGHNTEGKAAGWIESVALEDDNTSLWVDIKYTPEAEKAVLETEWRFISADIDFEYEDNESGMMLGPVLLGAGLVNRPHIKSMKAVFGEIGESTYNNEPTKPKGFSMTPEEMMKKIGELEAMISQLKASVSSKDESMAEADKAIGDMKTECADAKEQLKEATTKLVKLTEENELVSKEAKFSEYLSAGKVVPAQKEAFMSMTVEMAEKLFKDAKAANFSDKGHGKENTGTNNDGDKSASDIVDERATEMMKTNSTIKLGEAYSKVLSQDKELAEKYADESRLHS